MATSKNRYPHPFRNFVFVEATQVVRFCEKCKLWKSGSPLRLFGPWVLVRGSSNRQAEGCATDACILPGGFNNADCGKASRGKNARKLRKGKVEIGMKQKRRSSIAGLVDGGSRSTSSIFLR